MWTKTFMQPYLKHLTNNGSKWTSFGSHEFDSYRNLTYGCDNHHRKKEWISVIPVKEIFTSHGRGEKCFRPSTGVIFSYVILCQNFHPRISNRVHFSYLLLALDGLENSSSEQDVNCKQNHSNKENFCAVRNPHFCVMNLSLIRKSGRQRVE